MCSVATWPHCVRKREPQFHALWRNVSKQWRREVILLVRVPAWTMVVFLCLKLTSRCRSTGLDIDGLYRVSGNLAVIQKLRFKADHGKVYSRFMHLEAGSRGFPVDLTAYNSTLTSCAPACVRNRGARPRGRPVGGRARHHRGAEVVFPRASGAAVPVQPL